MRIALDNGPAREVDPGVTVAQALKELGVAMDHEVVAARVNGQPVDLTASLAHDATLAPIEVHSPEGLEIMRHSTSHLMAEAVRDLFPGVKVAIGPAIEAGFYYDFDTKEPFTPEDLTRIEGIDEHTADALRGAGILTYAQLAAADQERLDAILKDVGLQRAVDWSTWSEQAALCAAGRWEDLETLQDEQRGGQQAG